MLRFHSPLFYFQKQTHPLNLQIHSVHITGRVLRISWGPPTERWTKLFFAGVFFWGTQNKGRLLMGSGFFGHYKLYEHFGAIHRSSQNDCVIFTIIIIIIIFFYYYYYVNHVFFQPWTPKGSFFKSFNSKKTLRIFFPLEKPWRFSRHSSWECDHSTATWSSASQARILPARFREICWWK